MLGKIARYVLITLIIASVVFIKVDDIYGTTSTQTLTVTGESGYVYYDSGASDAYSTGSFTDIQNYDGNTWVAQWSTAICPYTGYSYRAWHVSTFTGGGDISAVTVYWRGSGSTIWGAAHTPFLRIGGMNYLGGGSNDTTYALQSYTWSVNPATGVAWTTSDINNADYGMRGYSSCALGPLLIITYVDQMYVVVSYHNDPPTVETDAVTSNIYSGGSYNVTLNGEITDDGGNAVTQVGFVYGTSSNATAPGNIAPSGTGYTTDVHAHYTDYGEDTFLWLLGSLTGCTTYYSRFYAYNSQGYTYGDEVQFTTLCPPTATTSAVSRISSTTARLNALVTSDGGQATDVMFAYGTTSASSNCTAGSTCSSYSCNSSAYTTVTTWVENTYTTGQTPYVDITGLTAGTTYYVCAFVRNDVSCACGGQVTFTTSTGVEGPTSLKGIAGSDSVSLSWIKGTGSQYTVIRYKTGSYPSTTADGSSAYNGLQTSVTVTGLTSGTTYYVRAWGKSGAFTSTSNATLMITTLAGEDDETTTPTPTTPSIWFQAPDHTKMSGMPFYSIVNFALNSFGVPLATGWYMIAMICCVGAGIVFYSTTGNSNILLSVIVVGFSVVAGAILGLIPLWQIMPFAIIAVTGLIVGERR